MRGYIFKRGTTTKAVYSAQGGVGDVNIDEGFGFGPALRRVLPEMADGLHRANFRRIEEGWMVVVPGAAVKDAGKEADRLRNNAANQGTRARTASPGVCFSSRNPSMGYQHMAEMATNRLEYLRRESIALAEWLEGIGTNNEEKTK